MAIISLRVIADGVPELRECVTVTLMDVTTVGIQDLRQSAVIDKQWAQALLTILPNGSPYGVIGWHLDSQFTLTQEPESKNYCCKKVKVCINLIKLQRSFIYCSKFYITANLFFFFYIASIFNHLTFFSLLRGLLQYTPLRITVTGICSDFQ